MVEPILEMSQVSILLKELLVKSQIKAVTRDGGSHNVKGALPLPPPQKKFFNEYAQERQKEETEEEEEL